MGGGDGVFEDEDTVPVEGFEGGLQVVGGELLGGELSGGERDAGDVRSGGAVSRGCWHGGVNEGGKCSACNSSGGNFFADTIIYLGRF